MAVLGEGGKHGKLSSRSDTPRLDGVQVSPSFAIYSSRARLPTAKFLVGFLLLVLPGAPV